MLMEVQKQPFYGCFRVRYHPIGSSEEFPCNIRQFFNGFKEIIESAVVNCLQISILDQSGIMFEVIPHYECSMNYN